jgi:hypothetical protein
VLNRAWLDGETKLGDLQWAGVGTVNLTSVTWFNVPTLGDERQVGQHRGEILHEYQRAVRAYRQLAVHLRAQGMDEVADRFTYRARVLQRQVLRRTGRWGAALGSWLLDRIAGYGYKPLRSFATYALVVGAFAAAYYLLGTTVKPPLDPLGAVVFSITSFHGRGFAPGENVLITDPLSVLAAMEAMLGLFIEITFIATFTQRFLGK